MVTNYCGLFLLLVFRVLIIVEKTTTLELLDMHVPAYVVLGTRAQLTCRWMLGSKDVLYSVKWYKDGKEFFRHVPRDSEAQRKFPLPGVEIKESDSSGSNLVLADVVWETAGRYRCEVSGERPLFPTVSHYSDMNVVVLPDKNPVITGLEQSYGLGDHIQVNCTSGRSRPTCQLSWYINDEPAPASAVLLPIYESYPNELQTTTLSLDFKLTDQYFTRNRIRLKCLTTLVTLYWQSSEVTATIDNMHQVLPYVNVATDFKMSSFNTICGILTLFTYNLFV